MVSGTAAIPILMFHRIGAPPPGALVPGHYVPKARFERMVRALRRFGYTGMRLHDAYQALQGQAPLPKKPVVVTFDDGYRHLIDRAFPALRREGFSATVFLVVDRAGGRNEWDIVQGDAPEEVMSLEEARGEEHGGIEFGSHGLTHVRLTAVSAEVARTEVTLSRQRLESALGKPVMFFCYPYGAMNPEVRRLVLEAGYLGACSTIKGVNVQGCDPFGLRRLNVRRDTWTPFLFWKIHRALRAQPNAR